MRRRRRPQREIAFSFDSFLDVVANVVGVILRLILVAWVGARTYKATLPTPPPMPAALADPEPLPEPTDPRQPLLAQRRRDIDGRRGGIDAESARLAAVAEAGRQLRADLDALKMKQSQLASEEKAVRGEANQRSSVAKQANLTVAELKARGKKLADEMAKLGKMPTPRKELRYRTPVSAPLQTEEMMFECKEGRVTLIDHGAMLAEVKREVRSKQDQLRTNWQVSDTTAAVGAFRLRYHVERERSALDAPGVGPSDGSFRYGVSGWEVEPVTPTRGEAADRALAGGSEFRRVTDALDPQQTAVTFWVYPDSFGLYRKLRDFLHKRDVVVAGRPLPEGAPIASSRHGTASRGQ